MYANAAEFILVRKDSKVSILYDAFMGWSQTEPTTKTKYTQYNHFYFGDDD
jgi:hypothetical protein